MSYLFIIKTTMLLHYLILMTKSAFSIIPFLYIKEVGGTIKVKYINNKKTLDFGYCKVVKETEYFYGIYRKDKLLTHKKSWRQATKIAALLKEAYEYGYKIGEDDCTYAYEMDESHLY